MSVRSVSGRPAPFVPQANSEEGLAVVTAVRGHGNRAVVAASSAGRIARSVLTLPRWWWLDVACLAAAPEGERKTMPGKGLEPPTRGS